MVQTEKKHWAGQLSLDLLFEGSKSEAFYPVLHCEDGTNYRVYLKGLSSLNKDILNHFMGQQVLILGASDNLRGHWRLVVDATEPGFLTESSATTPNAPLVQSSTPGTSSE
jgi:hypothetical protein